MNLTSFIIQGGYFLDLKLVSQIVSPRFGLVPCIQAIHDIAAGEEIFVLYGYDLDYCPDWYMEAWDKGIVLSS